jgi:hypothetical protein
VTVYDVIEVLKTIKIPASEVDTFSKGMAEKEVSVVFKSTLPLNALSSATEPFKINNKLIRVTCSGKQVVAMRVHWLQVFASDSMVEAFLKPYGQVIGIHNDDMSIGTFKFKSGVRVVRMEVDDIQRKNIPHLLKFECGNKALLTIQGRPLLCLKCLTVGQYRNACSGQTSNFNEAYFKVQKSFSETAKKVQEERLQNAST